MRITDDVAADAVWVYLTGEPLSPGRAAIQADTPPAVDGFIALGWKDGRLAGLEILDASRRPAPLHHAPCRVFGARDAPDPPFGAPTRV